MFADALGEEYFEEVETKDEQETRGEEGDAFVVIESSNGGHGRKPGDDNARIQGVHQEAAKGNAGILFSGDFRIVVGVAGYFYFFKISAESHYYKH